MYPKLLILCVMSLTFLRLSNQFATKEYYLGIFRDYFLPWGWTMDRPMEFRMSSVASLYNCSAHGPWLYGRHAVDGPYLRHLDGRNRQEYHSSSSLGQKISSSSVGQSMPRDMTVSIRAAAAAETASPGSHILKFQE